MQAHRTPDPPPEPRRAPPGLRREAARKAIHVASIAIPLAVWLLPQSWAVLGTTVLAGTALGVEWARFRVRPVRYVFLRRTRTMLRPHERRGLAGATHMAIAYAMALLLFPEPVAVAAMLYNGLGDAAAALVGRRFGRHRTSWGKSWEGFAAGLTVSLAVGFLVPGVPPVAAVLGGVLAAVLEFAPLPLDDNVRVTLGGGAGAWLGSLLG